LEMSDTMRGTPDKKMQLYMNTYLGLKFKGFFLGPEHPEQSTVFTERHVSWRENIYLEVTLTGSKPSWILMVPKLQSK